jgi:hypothetical protein
MTLLMCLSDICTKPLTLLSLHNSRSSMVNDGVRALRKLVSAGIRYNQCPNSVYTLFDPCRS